MTMQKMEKLLNEQRENLTYLEHLLTESEEIINDLYHCKKHDY